MPCLTWRLIIDILSLTNVGEGKFLLQLETLCWVPLTGLDHMPWIGPKLHGTLCGLLKSSPELGIAIYLCCLAMSAFHLFLSSCS